MRPEVRLFAEGRKGGGGGMSWRTISPSASDSRVGKGSTAMAGADVGAGGGG